MGDIVFLPGKLLQEAIYPFNWAIVCFIVSAIFIRRNRVRIAFRLQMAGLLLLIVPATGHVSNALISPLETYYPSRKIDEFPESDLIVVLGGTVSHVRAPRIEAEETTGSRVQAAVKLFRAGKGKTILVSGGAYPAEDGFERSEAEDMRDLLVALGVPRESILMEPHSRNTYENAVFTAKLVQGRSAKRVLLVTSALHLPRAVALFRRQGVDATPVPCSFLRGPGYGFLAELKPDSNNLHQSESAIKEYVGRFVYWLMGRA